jgi:ammonium transporter, Amt family
MKFLFFFLTVLPSFAFAADIPKLDSGNTAWVLVATALVMFMTPAGLALFYGGMTRSKNLLNTFAMSIIAYILGSIVWITLGYTLSFGSDIGGVIGSLEFFMLDSIKITDLYAPANIPTLVFAAFQMTFACIAVAVVSGAIIERMRFISWMIFVAIWVIAVYAPIAHAVWGGGFLQKMGLLDFAGGCAIEINSGISGLVLAIMIGKRRDLGKTAIFPSSIAFTALGAGMLWFGWFGFNAGSALTADGSAANAMLTTNTAASAAALSWMIIEYMEYKKFTLLGIASGIVAGLVAITPAAGFVDVKASLFIGLAAGGLAFYGVNHIKKRFGYDDSLDVFGVHALCGILGLVAVGLVASPAISPAKGLFYGNAAQLGIQLVGIFFTIAYSAVATFGVYKLTALIAGNPRPDEAEEAEGLDETEHGEKAFSLR